VEWAARINNALRQATQRPRALLVFVNPFGGARRARRTWQRVAEPVLAAAGAAALHALRTARVSSLSCRALQRQPSMRRKRRAW
jgi:diacylglycerol kinase family enzyme